MIVFLYNSSDNCLCIQKRILNTIQYRNTIDSGRSTSYVSADWPALIEVNVDIHLLMNVQ